MNSQSRQPLTHPDLSADVPMGPNKKPVVLTLPQPCSGRYVFNAVLSPLPDKDSSALYRKTRTFIF